MSTFQQDDEDDILTVLVGVIRETIYTVQTKNVPISRQICEAADIELVQCALHNHMRACECLRTLTRIFEPNRARLGICMHHISPRHLTVPWEAVQAAAGWTWPNSGGHR